VRAVVTRGDGIAALERVERATPAPGRTEVLVRVRAVSLNYRDLLVVRGEAQWKPTAPRVPGSDAVGEVVAAGDDVTRARVGDRVLPIFLPGWIDGELTAERYGPALGGAALDGVLAEYLVLDEQAVVRAPDHLSDAEAATLPVAALTAWHALRRIEVREGDSVLFQGTGGVSLAALQIAVAIGAHPIVLSGSDEKLRRVRAMGARETINYRTTPEWDAAVLDLTGGRGVDHVLEVVGGSNLNRSLAALRVSGSIAFVDLLAGLGGEVDTYRFVTRNVRLHGIETGSRAMLEEVIAFMARHRLHPVVDRTFGFDEIADALRHLERGDHFGKVVVTP